MKLAEVKELIINSLSPEKNTQGVMETLEEAGVKYSFSEGFRDKVIDRIFSASVTVNREIEFIRSMNSVFYRIALTGVAAIAILLFPYQVSSKNRDFQNLHVPGFSPHFPGWMIRKRVFPVI